MATRWQQRCTFGPRVLWSLPRGSFGFYRELQWQAHSSFSPNNVTEPQFQRFLQPPSAIFQATYHSIFPKYCYLLEQRILPSAFCSLPGNGNFSPLREVQKDRTKQPCKVARSAGYYGQITTGQPGWEHVGLVTKGKQKLSPYPQASVSSADKLWTLPGVVLSVGLLGSYTCCK